MNNDKYLKMLKNKKNNKRGALEYLMSNFVRICFTMVAITIFFLMINYYVNNKIDAQRLQEETLLNRILYSGAIMYSDPVTSRVYPGIVDIGKMDNANIDKEINYGEFGRHAAAKIKLERKITGNTAQSTLIKDAYLNKNQFDNWQPILNVPGKGSATMYITEMPVSYIDSSNKYDYATLSIEIIIPNS